MATKDYASPAQARLMRAVAHGWRPKKPRGKLPSRAVAEEFVEAKDRKAEGGLAMATGGSSWVGNWGSRKRKDLRLLDIMAPWRGDLKKVGKKERKRRAKAVRQQERGKFGEEIRTNVKDPRKRRALVRAGWTAYTPPESRKGVRGAKGRKGKMYAADLNKRTTFYPPSAVGAPGGTVPGGGVGLTRTIQYRDPSSYIAPTPGMYEGGLAPMSDIIQRGFAPELGFQEGGPVGIRTWKDIPGKTIVAKAINAMRMKEQGWVPSEYGEGVDLKSITWYPPEQTIHGPGPFRDEDTPPFSPPVGIRGRRGRGRRGRRGRDGEGEPPPPRVIPPGRPPGGDLVPPTQIPPDYVPPDPRAGRDTPYSERLRAHRERVAAILGVPSGYAGGGPVSNMIPASREVGYAEGGGTSRADNPYPVGSARWKVWERKHGRDPNAPEPEAEAPPPVEAEEEPISWLDRLRGVEGERRGRTEEELERLGEGRYRGGYIPESREVGYQAGGLARFARPPGGGVPPAMGGMMKPRMGGIPPRVDPRMMNMRVPVKSRPLTVPPSMGGGQPGPMGGPRIPPNLRGYLQREMMMNRPRRGIPGPAGAGGAPNRVGQGDQRGALARAMQRGTGRAPMSRRQGFYR